MNCNFNAEMYYLNNYLCDCFERSMTLYRVTGDERYINYCAELLLSEQVVIEHM